MVGTLTARGGKRLGEMPAHVLLDFAKHETKIGDIIAADNARKDEIADAEKRLAETLAELDKRETEIDRRDEACVARETELRQTAEEQEDLARGLRAEQVELDRQKAALEERVTRFGVREQERMDELSAEQRKAEAEGVKLAGLREEAATAAREVQAALESANALKAEYAGKLAELRRIVGPPEA